MDPDKRINLRSWSIFALLEQELLERVKTFLSLIKNFFYRVEILVKKTMAYSSTLCYFTNVQGLKKLDI